MRRCSQTVQSEVAGASGDPAVTEVAAPVTPMADAPVRELASTIARGSSASARDSSSQDSSGEASCIAERTGSA